jgi:hypothetical protein
MNREDITRREVGKVREMARKMTIILDSLVGHWQHSGNPAKKFDCRVDNGEG